MHEEKTNVMRILERKKIPFTAHHYPHQDGAVDGESVAGLIGKPSEVVCKTLVTVGASKKNYVFVIPVKKELELKLAAKAVGEKSIQMIRQAELLPLTGYIHGGCSPIGMKKQFPTVLDISTKDLQSIIVSAGKIGSQVELSPIKLTELIRGNFALVCK